VAGTIIRVKKHQCLKVTGAHVAKCVLGTASLALNMATIALWGWAKFTQFVHWRGIRIHPREWMTKLAHYQELSGAEEDAWSKRHYVSWILNKGRLHLWLKKNGPTFLHSARPIVHMIDAYYEVDSHLKVTKTMMVVSGGVRMGLGLTDEAAWTVLQHGMIGLWRSFDPGANRPRRREYQLVRQWPRGVWGPQGSARNIVMSCVRGLVPLHPAAPGLHNLRKPNDMAEARVCRQPGYVYEEPHHLPRWRRPWGRLLRAGGRFQRFCKQHVDRVATVARIRGSGYLRGAGKVSKRAAKKAATAIADRGREVADRAAAFNRAVAEWHASHSQP